MQFKHFALIAFTASTAVLAQSHGSGHHHHWPRPSGAGEFNGTTAANTTDTTVTMTRTNTVTVTVTPSTTLATSTSQVAAIAANNAAVNTQTSSDCGVSTVTEYSTQLVTVTLGADGSVISGSTSTTVATSTTTAVAAQQNVQAGSFYNTHPHNGGGSGGNGGNSQSTTTSAGVGISVSVGSGSSSISSAAAGATSSSSSGGTASSGSKKGISYNEASLISAFGNSVSWAYNWADSAGGSMPSNVEYVPMMWGVDSVSGFAAAAGNAAAVLSFNEPDLSSQSNIDPQTAAAKHIEGMQSLFGKARIGSPAITNADSTSPLMGLPWMTQFLEACNGGCHIDFLAFHWYAGAGDISYFESYVNQVASFAQQHGIGSIWLTEFKPDTGSDSDQAEFFNQAIPILEANSMVERYAGFMASDGTLLSGSSLNVIGKAYAG